MAENSPEELAQERRHRRGLKFRKREDHAVELFREAQASLGDVARVSRILIQLGRFYNPYVNSAIVDLATRRAIVERIEAGDLDAARSLLDGCLTRYAQSEAPADDGD